jgi:hypothetical protein
VNAIFDHPAFVWFTKHFFFVLMGIATLDTLLLVVDEPGSAWVYYDAAIAVICVLLALWLPPKEA